MAADGDPLGEAGRKWLLSLFFSFLRERGIFFGIMIIVHLPVAKFWAALIIGVHWLSRQVWSFASTLIANVAVSRAWIQAGFLPRWQSVFIRFQIDISGRQENGTPPSLDQICTSISCPQLGKKLSPSKCFPGLLSTCGAWHPRVGVAGGISGPPKARSFLDVFNGNIFQEERTPNLCVNLKSKRLISSCPCI